MESDGENFEDFYEDGDAAKHEELVEKVLSLNKTQNLKKPSRTEPTLKVSEFNLVKSITGQKGVIQIDELTKSLKHRKSRVKIGEKLKQTHKKAQTLPKPLEKPQADRIRRGVAYEKTRLQLDRWEPIVTSNRVAATLSFPLDNDVKLDKKLADNFPSMWRLKSDLEVELEKLEPKVEEYHFDLEKERDPLTLEKLLVKRKEAAKLRAYQGYQEAKARRRNKIKSKKFHRIEKRAKIKQKLAEFELLQKTNPEEALKKLEEIEQARVEERFSLRHKSTGKWARSKQIRAKYDKESRQVLAQQLMISRDLTQKTKNNDSDSEQEDKEDEGKTTTADSDNVWVNGVKPDKEVADFVSGYRKYWTEQNKSNSKEAGENNETQMANGEEVIDTPPANVETKKMGRKEINKSKKKSVELKKEEEIIGSKGVSETNKAPTKKKKSTEKKRNKEKVEGVKRSEVNLDDSKGTSEWSVTAINDASSNEVAVEHMFNRLEDKIQKQMLKNVKNLQKNAEKKIKRKDTKSSKETTYKPDLTMPSQVKRPIIDEELVEESGEAPNDVINSTVSVTALKTILTKDVQKKSTEIDPNKYLKLKTVELSTAKPDMLTTEDNEENFDRDQLILEGYEDDDLVEEFNKEKSDDVDKDKPKDVNLALPGWGCWGGANIKVNPRKKRRFTVKAPPQMPRRDDNKGALIINESAQAKIKEHKVSEVPFPFTTVKDYEASVRAPIGNTFVPETAFRRLIRPAVVTKMGAIISPMSKDMLLNKK